MFELSVACKYLIPRWRQLSVSIISLVSILVIALVVWLIIVFFSVKDGLENNWVNKIVTLTAPIRVTPTEKYYDSYYYLIDSVSAGSDYTTKSVGEKLQAESANPYDPRIDEELPAKWPKPDLDSQGNPRDLVKEVVQIASNISQVNGLKVSDFETTMAHLRLRFLRHLLEIGKQSQQFLDHATYIGSFDTETPNLSTMLLTPTAADFHNLLHMQEVANDDAQQTTPDTFQKVNLPLLQEGVKDFFSSVEIKALNPSSNDWSIPPSLLPKTANFRAAAILNEDSVTHLIIPVAITKLPSLIEQLNLKGSAAVPAEIQIDETGISVKLPEKEFQSLSPWVSITLQEGTPIPASLITRSLETMQKIAQIRFYVDLPIQNSRLKGEINLGKLEIAEAVSQNEAGKTFLALPDESGDGITLPNTAFGEPILLPRVFRDGGALIGDRGFLSYYSPTPSTIQEQYIPVVVVGFYDPGIMSIGGKYILANKSLTTSIRSGQPQEEILQGNGINIRFDNLNDTAKVKAALLAGFEHAGISQYWNVETYQEYPFSKDLIQQLDSEKNLFSIISLIIIIVACSNIISMLIILVNDKKLEIGILRSMGATSLNIAAIFGFCGIVMGTAGSLLGAGTAILTLRYINELTAFIGRLQGHDLFNPVFYGTVLPDELSITAIVLVVSVTAGISLLAGIVPALKASMLRPSAILRAE